VHASAIASPRAPEILKIPGSPAVGHAATPLFVRPRLSYSIASREAAAAGGAIPDPSVIQTILEQQKPEAAYFIADGGRRTGILIVPGDGAMGPGFAGTTMRAR